MLKLKLLKASAWSLGTGLLFFAGFFCYLSANTPKRDRYLIPEGYAGWLCVTYSVAGAPPLKFEDGFRLVKFSPSGVVATSTEGMPGKYKDEFWFYEGNRLRQMNIEKEMGGGYTVAKPEDPGHFTVMFWVSQNAKAQQPLQAQGKLNNCGPSE
ncbi:MAG: hypothetical protein LRY38_08565 [Aeromonadaceae bacterium]|nr:hypothetical protein [Aeromonadaceae bacterium]